MRQAYPGLGFDPAPGAAAAVDLVLAVLRDGYELVERSSARLGHTVTAGGWTGAAALAFRSHAATVPPELDGVAGGLDTANKALEHWQHQLLGNQRDAEQLDTRARGLRTAIEHAERAVATAARRAAATTGPQLPSALRELRDAHAELASLRTQLARVLDTARRLADRHLRQANVAAGRLRALLPGSALGPAGWPAEVTDSTAVLSGRVTEWSAALALLGVTLPGAQPLIGLPELAAPPPPITPLTRLEQPTTAAGQPTAVLPAASPPAPGPAVPPVLERAVQPVTPDLRPVPSERNVVLTGTPARRGVTSTSQATPERAPRREPVARRVTPRTASGPSGAPVAPPHTPHASLTPAPPAARETTIRPTPSPTAARPATTTGSTHSATASPDDGRTVLADPRDEQGRSPATPPRTEPAADRQQARPSLPHPEPGRLAGVEPVHRLGGSPAAATPAAPTAPGGGSGSGTTASAKTRGTEPDDDPALVAALVAGTTGGGPRAERAGQPVPATRMRAYLLRTGAARVVLVAQECPSERGFRLRRLLCLGTPRLPTKARE